MSLWIYGSNLSFSWQRPLLLTTQTSHPCLFQKSQFVAHGWFWLDTQQHKVVVEMQIDWMQAVPWRSLSRQASQEFIHNRSMWEKPEMFSVSGGEGRLYDECDTTEECFRVCTARVQRRKHGRVKTHCAPVFPFQTRYQSSIVFQNICGHFDFTATSLPPPHVCECTCLLWHVASSHLVLFVRERCTFFLSWFWLHRTQLLLSSVIFLMLSTHRSGAKWSL